jgi:tetratricopeptide (TPR) repeat protein
MYTHVRVVAILATALLVLSCKQDNNSVVNITQPSEEAIGLTSQGWVAFEAKNYSAALALFSQASEKNNLYADAYNGLAWSYARLDSLNKARKYFDVAIGLQFSMIDAYAGRAFVSLAAGNYPEAIDAVSEVQAIGPPFYVFRHDAEVSMNDLLLVKAQSYFLLQNYTGTFQIVNVLDPTNQLNPSSPTYVEELALEIEYLWSII